MAEELKRNVTLRLAEILAGTTFSVDTVRAVIIGAISLGPL